MRSVTEGIHCISLANNELKSLTSRFVTTFSQLRGKGQPHCFTTATSKPLGPSKEPSCRCRGSTAPESFPTAVFAPLCSHLIPSTRFRPPQNPFFFTLSGPCRKEALVLLSPTLPNSCPATFQLLSAVARLLQGHSSSSGSLQEQGWR